MAGIGYYSHYTGENIGSWLRRLSAQIENLKEENIDLKRRIDEKSKSPYSKVGANKDNSQIRPIDINTGLGQVMGGNIVWNDLELNIPPYKIQPIGTPEKGYNKHSHNRYSGGALNINTLEIVEYDTNESGEILDVNGQVLNKYCQGFWNTNPKIAVETDSTGNEQEKIGNLDLVFDPDDKIWKCYAVYKDEPEEE